MASCCGCCPDDSMRGDIVTDDFCGNFNVPCRGGGNPLPELLWRAANVLNGVETAGTVSVYYDSGCADELLMIPIVLVNGAEENLAPILIAPGNTRSYTTKNLVGLLIVCSSESNQQGSCRGKYCITYHYDVLAV
ncbi:DUF3992 domain-containing protein [Metabacillus sp. 84]|uniref:DUF3992 domain-containing protein n=1 Tax=unclassified Metabacillus TaxID=2675274 RepID=UPI003CF981A9